MNEIILKGLIKNSCFSHQINGVDYYKSDLIVPNNRGQEDIITLMFKKCLNPQLDNELISLTGTVRSYSKKLDDNKNKVSIYVFTYFDKPENNLVENHSILSGRICKIDSLKTMKSGKTCIHAILANNLLVSDGQLKLNNYIPIVFWGNLAQKASTLKVNDKISVIGPLHSRTYTKNYSDGSVEIRTAHEIVVLDYAETF